MQPIGEYLKKLLYQYDCVVVPALGAFLTHSVPASFSAATGQFLPPRRKLAFNAALLLDDGMLLTYLMLHENCSREQAGQRIDAFVAEVKQTVQEQGSYRLEGLGLFALNGDQRLQFDPELRHNFMGNAYGMQPLLVAHRQVHQAQPLTRLSVLPSVGGGGLFGGAAPVRALAPATDVLAPRVMPLPARRAFPVRRLALLALVGSLGVLSYLTVVEPNKPLESSFNPASLFGFTAPAGSGTLPIPAHPARPEPRLPVWAPTVTAPPATVANAATMPAPTTTRTASPAPVASPVASPVAAAVVAEIPAVLPAPVSPVVVARPVNENVSANVARRTAYTVIAGSFASRANAVRFKKRLLAAGYSDAFILSDQSLTGRGSARRPLIKVAALGTETLSAATAVVDSLHLLTGITPWVARTR